MIQPGVERTGGEETLVECAEEGRINLFLRRRLMGDVGSKILD